MINNSSNMAFIKILTIILGIPLLFFSTTSSMVHTWYTDGSFNHGFLIFPISIWLIYQKKPLLSQIEVEPEPRLLVLLSISALTWILANIVDVQVAQQFALISIIPISIWILYGRKLLTEIIFPILFLFFAVPMGKSLTPPMMDFTADFTVWMLQLVSIPVYRDGLFFTLPTGNWSVVEACSGVRYLIATLTLSTLYAYLTFNSYKKRILFVAIAAIVSVFANGVRAFGIVIIGHTTDMEYGTGGDHTFYGWIFYGLIIFLLFFIGNYWADAPEADNPTETLNKTKINSIGYLLPVIIISVSLIQIIPSAILNIPEANIQTNTLSIPNSFGGWQQTEQRDLDWQPAIINADINISNTYLYGEDLVKLNIGYYQQQKQGAEAVTSENHLVGNQGKGWQKSSGIDIKINDTYITETILTRSGQKIMVWQWYIIGKMQTPTPVIAKILNAANLIFYRRNDATFITIATPLIQSVEHSRSQLKAFQEDAYSDIYTILTQVNK